MRLQRGFSLLELMIALAVAGTIFFVALPAWRSTLLKSYRMAGKGVLLDVLARQEQYLVDNHRYSRSLPALGLPADYYIDAQARQVAAARAIYRVELQLDPETDAFIGVRAVPQNRQRGDRRCMTLAISRVGVRSVSGSHASTPHRCW